MGLNEPDVSGNGNDGTWSTASLPDLRSGLQSDFHWNAEQGAVTWTNGAGDRAYVPFVEGTTTPTLTNITGYAVYKTNLAGYVHNDTESSLVINSVTNSFINLSTNVIYNATTDSNGFITEVYLEN